MSFDDKTKSYQIYQGVILLLIILYQPSILQFLQFHAYWHYDNWGIWSDDRLFDKIRLVIYCSYYQSDSHTSHQSITQSILLMICTLRRLAYLSILAIDSHTLSFIGLIYP